MGRAWGLCACSRKNDKNDIRREKFKFFVKEVFSAEQFTINGLFYTSYKMAISVQNRMLKVNYFLQWKDFENRYKYSFLATEFGISIKNAT